MNGARRSRHDLRGAIRSLTTVLRKTVACLDSLVLKGRQVDERLKRIEDLLARARVDISERERAPAEDQVPRGALGGPYWEARAKALHERENWNPGRIQWVEMDKLTDHLLDIEEKQLREKLSIRDVAP
jgi:hypothetical protein